MTRQQAVLELIFAGSLWGFGFVATIWALKGFTPSEVLAIRFLIAVAAGELIWFLFFRKYRQEGQAKSDILLALPAGLLLAALLLPQTIGLQTTSAAKSGFLTTLYVIFVPFLNRIVFQDRIHFTRYFYALLALVGAFFLVNANLNELVIGDLWTIACALFAAFHILYIDAVSKKIKDSFRFNTFQSLFCGLAVLIPIFFEEHSTNMPKDAWAWGGILILALGSSLIGFTIQVRTQKVLNPTSAAMLFLLESPFALVFGLLILGETFSPKQAFGATLILLSAALSVKADASHEPGPSNSKPKTLQ